MTHLLTKRYTRERSICPSNGKVKRFVYSHMSIHPSVYPSMYTQGCGNIEPTTGHFHYSCPAPYIL